MDKIIIIGGAGAIGLNLVEYLSKYQAQVFIVDNLSSSFRNEKLPNVELIYANIEDKAKITDVIRSINPDYVYNLAAHFANQNSVDYPYEDINTNIIGQLNVLEACKGLDNLKKYVYASSSCVYGSSAVMKETDLLYPYETPYAINKFVGELYTKYFSSQFGLPCVSVRIFNTYGKFELAGKYRNVIPNFIDKALKNETITITGSGDETRDFTFSQDTAHCLHAAAESKYCEGEVFNSGTGKSVKIKELVELILEYTNSQSKVEYKERRKWDHVSSRRSDINLSKDLLGYEPKTNLSDGLSITIDWYKSQIQC